MNNFWNKIFGKKTNNYQINIAMPNPNTDNEYKFYRFVELTPKHILEGIFEKYQNQEGAMKSQYLNAIKQQIKTGDFKNPHTLQSYFNNKFDYIGIDFETANHDRISACALGLAFVKDNTIVSEDFYYIKPPEGTKFLRRHIKIHGIQERDVRFAFTFEELWETKLKDIFNQNLIFLHNASMDASILKQLLVWYKIKDYHINYVCTMKLAKRLGYSGELTEICRHFNIEFLNHHDPKCDAIACVKVAAELLDLVDNIDDYKEKITDSPDIKLTEKRVVNNFKKGNPFHTIERQYLFPKKNADEKTNKYFQGKKVVITGELEHYPIRNDLAKILWELGADVDTRVSERTHILILGKEYGYKKLEQAQKNIADGLDMVILNEEELLKLLPSDN